jgi:TetR/AcrR family transcriptional regulator
LATKTAAPVKRTRMPADERRAGILKASRQVFLESGLAGARTKVIAELAGTSEAILYRHFSSKEELFEAAVLEPLTALIAQMTAAATSMAQLPGRASRTQASYESNAVVLAGMREVAPLLGIALYSDRETGKKFYRKRIEPLMRELTQTMADSLEGWSHKPISPELVIAIHLGVYNWIAMQEHFGSRKPDGDAISRELTDVTGRAL